MTNWLRKIRLEKKLTQEQVAKRANIPRTTYSSIEQGRRRPSVRNAMRIASILEFDWTLFFEKK
ncbi:helix-turn-helix transcriptional regulator [Enterococcus sp. AZ109]|uniref:helix-turn-helix transcriptional regulator n=1 Tax=Enterococcus sp. AZ109 TaxID=2774634 RepID=UPI003F683C49